MSKEALWGILRMAIRALGAHYIEDMDLAAKSLDLDPRVGHLIIPAFMFQPDPISVERLRVRMPYNAPGYYGKGLLALKEADYFSEVRAGEYLLTDRGDDAFKKIVAAAYGKMDALNAHVHDIAGNLRSLLLRLVQASMVSTDPVSKWSIIYSRRLDMNPDASHLVKVDQYLSDLGAYRDDAHLASWRHHEVSAHAWEILSVIWEDKAQDFDGVVEALKMRRWLENETKKAVDVLVQKGWIVEKEGLHLTDQGREIRDVAEALTDQYFFSPWEVLSGTERNHLEKLLKQLVETLTKLQE